MAHTNVMMNEEKKVFESLKESALFRKCSTLIDKTKRLEDRTNTISKPIG